MGDTRSPSPSAVRAQVDKLQHSAVFAGSERLVAFLRFIVDETLRGQGTALKETIVGNAVYGRDPGYDPRIDSTVRVEARRLRRKLKDYYESEGKGDPVRIGLPTGGYVPVFTTDVPAVEAAPAARPPSEPAKGIFEAGRGAAIAVMPFRALSRDLEDESFAEGLTDELIFALDRAPGLRVASRSATFQYRDKSYSTVTLAAELGVDAVLQGTVRREGERMRVTIEASDPRGFVVWSDRFDASGRDRMRLQEQIAATAFSRIRFDSSSMRAARVGPGPVALEAMAKVYRARQLQDRQSPDGLREAMDLFAEVAAAAPDYARGHSGVADCFCDLFRLGLIERPVAREGARAAVTRALAIDARSIEAHTADATIAAWLDWDRAAAEAKFRQALSLGENARTLRLHGVLLTILERHEEAERAFRQSRAIEPFSSQQDIAEALCHYQSRRYRTLIEAKPDGDARPASPEALFFIALACAFEGEAAAARSLAAELERTMEVFPDLLCAAAEIAAWLGDKQAGRRKLRDAGAGASAFARATLAAAADAWDDCLDALEVAVGRRELSAVWIRTDARFDFLRDTDRFRGLIEGLDALAPTSTPPARGR